MSATRSRRVLCTLIPLFLLPAPLALTAQAGVGGDTLSSRTAAVDGVTFHYLTAGHGPAVVLLHGYTQTSRMWRPIIPLLAKKFTVIAPDLPGIGESSVPKDGVDMKTSATRIHALIRSLGIQRARVVGHDIGLMVAYAYAAQFPNETEKLVLMDAPLPGVAGWQAAYDDPGIWHFRFTGPTPEALVRKPRRASTECYGEPGGVVVDGATCPSPITSPLASTWPFMAAVSASYVAVASAGITASSAKIWK